MSYYSFLSFLVFFAMNGLQASGLLEQAAKRLFTGVKPIRQAVLHELQKDFFIENRKNVLVERIDARTLYVHDNRREEREKHLYTPSSSGQNDKQFSLLKKIGGKVVDRRLAVQNHIVSPYSAICLLRGIYNLTHRDELIYYGTGFRNGLNQVITAGHNLSFNQSEIEKICTQKKISLGSDYRFKPRNLTIEAIFGFKENPDSKAYFYTHLSRINGSQCVTHRERDFGVLSLPADKSVFLDESIGGLSVRFLPDQPHQYFNREITIVGFPGEKSPRGMYAPIQVLLKTLIPKESFITRLIHPKETAAPLVF